MVQNEPPDFPMQRTCPFDPPAEYATLREERPVSQVRVPTGQTPWLVTRYEDVRALLTDPRVSADRFHPGMPMTEQVTEETRRRVAASGRSLIGLDQPEHGPRRRMLIPEFTLRRINGLRPHIQETVDDCVGAMLRGPRPVDLVEALAMIVPARTLTELLGMPYEDRGVVERTTTAMLRRSVTPQERQRIGGEMRAYVDRLLASKEAEPTDDLLGRLVLRNRETGLYDHELMIGLTMLLLIAGFETTVNMIALGVAGLLQHPDQVEEIRTEPKAAAAAVEELLRYFSVVDALPRVAVDDIRIGDVTIPAGDGILLSFASADRDEKIFPDPAVLDIHRDARAHMAFGFGIHQCIGANLARAELEIVFRTLFTRIPGIRLDVDLDRVAFKKDSNIYGIDELPVTW
jgi:cytochrome P450